jgi:spermidine synthase
VRTGHSRTVAGATCLLLSGAAALFYELIWTHQFSTVFGSSEIATASVLGVYLAGLGLGAALASKRCRKSRRPLTTYAVLEGVIALSALAVPWGLRWSQELFYRRLATDGLPVASLGGSWLWQLALTTLLLAVPTLCLGASFPYAVRGLVRDDRQAGRTTAWLYSANVLGAVTGSLAAGLIVVPTLGIQASTRVGAALSLAAAALAVAVLRGPAAEPDRETRPAAAADGARFPFATVVVLGGTVSLATQILWTRLLIHFVGSGLYALSILLAAFLLGLAIGSAIAGSVGSSPSRCAAGFAGAQIFLAVASWTAFVALDAWAGAGQAVIMSFTGRLLRGASIAGLTLMPMAAGSGAAFLFAIGAATRRAADAAPTVARAYKLTAVGNLAGGILLALVVFPRLGFAGSQELLVVLSLLAAALAAWRTEARRVLLPCAGVLAIGLLFLPLPNAYSVLSFSPLTGSTDPGAVVFAELGTSASVVLSEAEGEWNLRTNGLGEGSIQPRGVSPSRYVITRWLGLLPFMARPESRDVLVIGLGAGTTMEAVPSTVERIAVVEIERQVVTANRAMAGRRRRDPLADPRVELVINDARDVLNRSRRTFDIIISQPSHPWTAGAANLYTREFFAAARSRLRPGGVLAQWLGLPFVDEALLRSVLATLADVFPYVEVYQPPPGGALIFLASDEPMNPRPAAALRDELIALGIGRQEDIAALWALSAAGVRQAAAGAELVTDDHNLLACRSPRVLGHGLGRTKGSDVLAEHDPLMGELGGLSRLALVQRLLTPERVDRVARAEVDAARRQLDLTWLPATGARERRPLLLSSILEIAPDDEVVRATALVAAKPLVAGGDAPPAALRELTPSEGLLVDGWRAAATGDWSRVRALDDPLAALPASSPLYWEAVLLRAQWRVRSDRPQDMARALSLLDGLLSHEPKAPALTLYAVAAERAGLPAGSLAALSDLSRLPAAQRSPGIDAAARRLLDSLRSSSHVAAWIDEIARRLAA